MNQFPTFVTCHELIYRPSRSRTSGETIVIANDDAASSKTTSCELDRSRSRFVEIYINVCDSNKARNVRRLKNIRYPASDKADSVTPLRELADNR